MVASRSDSVQIWKSSGTRSRRGWTTTTAWGLATSCSDSHVLIFFVFLAFATNQKHVQNWLCVRSSFFLVANFWKIIILRFIPFKAKKKLTCQAEFCYYEKPHCLRSELKYRIGNDRGSQKDPLIENSIRDWLSGCEMKECYVRLSICDATSGSWVSPRLP